jgi:hypothetical protein
LSTADVCVIAALLSEFSPRPPAVFVKREQISRIDGMQFLSGYFLSFFFHLEVTKKRGFVENRQVLGGYAPYLKKKKGRQVKKRRCEEKKIVQKAPAQVF